MRIHHNGRERTVDPAQHGDLPGLLRAILAREGGPPEVALRVAVDGRELETHDAEGLAVVDLHSVERLELDSAPPAEVARHALDRVAGYAPEVEGALVGAAARFRAGEVEEGEAVFGEALDALTVVVWVLGTAAECLGGAEEPLRGLAPALEPWIAELEAARAAGDVVRLADCLEHELAPRVREAGERAGEAAARRAPQPDAAG